MSLIFLTIATVALMLFTVVRDTDSCMSWNWSRTRRSRSPPVMTTTTTARPMIIDTPVVTDPIPAEKPLIVFVYAPPCVLAEKSPPKVDEKKDEEPQKLPDNVNVNKEKSGDDSEDKEPPKAADEDRNVDEEQPELTGKNEQPLDVVEESEQPPEPKIDEEESKTSSEDDEELPNIASDEESPKSEEDDIAAEESSKPSEENDYGDEDQLELVNEEDDISTEYPQETVIRKPGGLPGGLPESTTTKTVIIIEGPWVTKTLQESFDEPCPDGFGEVYCLNGGDCFIESTMGNNPKARCECKKPFSGERCMHKEPDGEYTTLTNHLQHPKHHEHHQLQETVPQIYPQAPKITKLHPHGPAVPETPLQVHTVSDVHSHTLSAAKASPHAPVAAKAPQHAPVAAKVPLHAPVAAKAPQHAPVVTKHHPHTPMIPIIPPVRDISKETININGVPCPNDEKYQYFCGGVGRCFMILFSEIDFVIGCECEEPYYGLRCEEKHFDGYYGRGWAHHELNDRYTDAHSGENRYRRQTKVEKMRKKENRRFHATA